MFSTNTLAQGMNLPADIVIIVRLGAYSQEAGTYQNVEVHDLLNAAGRAGRAGHSANGLVLVIPDRIVTFNAAGQISGSGLDHLKDGVLAQDDRCLSVQDPVEVLLDALQGGQGYDEEVLHYFLLRLPPRSSDEEGVERGKRFLGRSFAAFNAARNGLGDLFLEKVSAAYGARQEILGADVTLDVEAVCAATGLAPSTTNEILEQIQNLRAPLSMTAVDWGRWFLSLVESLAGLRFRLLKSTVGSKHHQAISLVEQCLDLWLKGRPLRAMEEVLGTDINRLGHLKLARKFARETTREISFGVGLAAQLAAGVRVDNWEEVHYSATSAALLIRDGVDTREKWALMQMMRDQRWTRVRVHQESREWLAAIRPSSSEQESARDLFRRVAASVMAYRNATRRVP